MQKLKGRPTKLVFVCSVTWIHTCCNNDYHRCCCATKIQFAVCMQQFSMPLITLHTDMFCLSDIYFQKFPSYKIIFTAATVCNAHPCVWNRRLHNILTDMHGSIHSSSCQVNLRPDVCIVANLNTPLYVYKPLKYKLHRQHTKSQWYIHLEFEETEMLIMFICINTSIL